MVIYSTVFRIYRYHNCVFFAVIYTLRLRSSARIWRNIPNILDIIQEFVSLGKEILPFFLRHQFFSCNLLFKKKRCLSSYLF